ncbi:MAG: hypothetical protein KIT87_22995 [Anaerolineae bacterium]|nr:hypothetical protein [Anaerolineae bacterium]
MPQPLSDRTYAYHGYLLRLWRASRTSPWQIVAKDVETGDEFPFLTLENLLDFLRTQMANGSDKGGAH